VEHGPVRAGQVERSFLVSDLPLLLVSHHAAMNALDDARAELAGEPHA